MNKSLVGCLLLAAALITLSGCVLYPDPYYPYYPYHGYYGAYGPRPYYPHYGPPRTYWEPGRYDREGNWVPGHWRRWIPGHHNQEGTWVPGYWDK